MTDDKYTYLKPKTLAEVQADTEWIEAPQDHWESAWVAFDDDFYVLGVLGEPVLFRRHNPNVETLFGAPNDRTSWRANGNPDWAINERESSKCRWAEALTPPPKPVPPIDAVEDEAPKATEKTEADKPRFRDLKVETESAVAKADDSLLSWFTSTPIVSDVPVYSVRLPADTRSLDAEIFRKLDQPHERREPFTDEELGRLRARIAELRAALENARTYCFDPSDVKESDIIGEKADCIVVDDPLADAPEFPLVEDPETDDVIGSYEVTIAGAHFSETTAEAVVEALNRTWPGSTDLDEDGGINVDMQTIVGQVQTFSIAGQEAQAANDLSRITNPDLRAWSEKHQACVTGDWGVLTAGADVDGKVYWGPASCDMEEAVAALRAYVEHEKSHQTEDSSG